MKDLFLILILLATFAFGYYVVVRFGDFIEENQRLIAEGNRNSQCKDSYCSRNPDAVEFHCICIRELF